MSTISNDRIIYELKEKAKWNDGRLEKKSAIKELSTFGGDAIPTLEEIFYVSAYDEIRVACMDAIEAITMRTDKVQSSATKSKGSEPENMIDSQHKLSDLPP